MSATEQEIKIAHSPDSDDAFMFYGLATNKVRVPGLKFTHVLCDIETLNQKAINETFYDVTAISFHAYPYIQDRYALMPSGGSVGEGYGPMIVSTKPYTLDEVKKLKIAIPGELTTAALSLRIFCPEVQTEIVEFDKIIPAVLDGKYEAGLIIHEGQITYDRNGLHRILDMGKWWRELTGLPLPLGANAIKKSLGPEVIAKVCKALKDSIQHALDNREQALEYAMQFARDLDTRDADKFVGMYVNERTLDYGDDGRVAVAKLLQMGHEKGVIPNVANIQWVSENAAENKL
ncbi:MAG: ABC transporter substrate-binding protein [Acidobacteriota bacterium]|nr:ABC transporter substrate-binding protein [Acidobacteriota bacterium]